MKKKLIGIFVCMLLIATVLPASGTVMVERTPMSTSLGDTLYVGGSGPGNYSTIQKAVNAASDGDTVFVCDDSSPYYENVIIDNSINLIGEDSERTIIDGREISDHVVQFISDYVTLTGFTIRNSESGAGVGIRGENNSIIGNIITRNRYGIILFGVGPHVNSDCNEIIDNIISNNEAGGIRLDDVSYITINDNKIFYNNNYGIASSAYGGSNVISNNYVANHGLGIAVGSQNLITHNIVSNNDVFGIQVDDDNDISDNSISNQTQLGRAAIIIRGYNNTITRNNFFNNYRHARLGFQSSTLWDFSNPLKILYKNKWDKNYWDESDLRRKVIIGIQKIHVVLLLPLLPLTMIIPSINIDWNPAQEPYDIGV